jgi:hypothetical protein
VPISDDADPDILISRLAGPLAPADRVAFRRAAEAALARVPCWGEGAVYRAVAVLQRAYFVPTVVIMVGDKPPAFARLALDVGLTGLALGVERAEGEIEVNCE